MVAPPVAAAAVVGPQTALALLVAPALVVELPHVVGVHPTRAEVVPEVVCSAATVRAAETGPPAYVGPHTPGAAASAGNPCLYPVERGPLVAPGTLDAGSLVAGSPGLTHTPAAGGEKTVALATLHPAGGEAAPYLLNAGDGGHPGAVVLGCCLRCDLSPAACCRWPCPP